MGTRFTAAIGYAGGSVGVEIDVVFETPKEFDSNVGRWRNPDGSFASPPDVENADALRERAEYIRDGVAGNMRSPELEKRLSEADIAVENPEIIGNSEIDGAGDTRSMVRIDSDGDGTVDAEYRVTEQLRLQRFD